MLKPTQSTVTTVDRLSNLADLNKQTRYTTDHQSLKQTKDNNIKYSKQVNANKAEMC